MKYSDNVFSNCHIQLISFKPVEQYKYTLIIFYRFLPFSTTSSPIGIYKKIKLPNVKANADDVDDAAEEVGYNDYHMR